MNKRTDEKINKNMIASIKGWMGRWKERWMEGLMDGWRDK